MERLKLFGSRGRLNVALKSDIDKLETVSFQGVTHLFFDLDDTLWDFEGNAYVAHQVLFDKYDLGRWFDSFEHYFTIYSVKNVELWRQYARDEVTKDFLSVERFAYPLRMVNAPEKFAETMGTEFLNLTTEQNRLLPYALDFLHYAADKYTLSVISNGFCEIQYKKMRNSGLAPFFKHVVLSEHVGSLKPNKEIYEYALELNGVSAEQTLMIGDNYESDIKGAFNAGIKAVLFNPHKKSVPDDVYQIFSLQELFDIL